MTSKTRLLACVTGFEWRPLEGALLAEPRLAAFVDERGRNLLHLCCGVNPKPRRLRAPDSVKTAAILLAAGIDLDREFQDSRGMTALHHKLEKPRPELQFLTLIQHGARGDLPNREGVTAAQIMSRKRSPGLRRMAEALLRERTAG